jgi:hypothetical protein
MRKVRPGTGSRVKRARGTFTDSPQKETTGLILMLSMRHALVALALCLVSIFAYADEPYTLVLGLGSPGKGLAGYREFALNHCPTPPCATFFELKTTFDCAGFYQCIVTMMKHANHIIFLTDRPHGLLDEDDELCTLEDRGAPDDGQHTGLELCILRHCELLYCRTTWLSRSSDESIVSFAQSDDECP